GTENNSLNGSGEASDGRSIAGTANAAGASSGSGSAGHSSSSPAKTANTARASFAGHSAFPMKVSYLGIWISLLLVVLTLFPVAIWIFFKASRESEEAARANEVPYRTLDTEQILGKIISK
ncbi:MAG TPA: hypothetical protein VKH62_03160, partial [Candidatus Binatia bacterium]|nr:hypothetical protein [Candidatus Binatia bacterium]